MISEIYLGRRLFPSEVDSSLEHLAIIEKILGPFPEPFARNVEQKFAEGMFTFSQFVTVAFPPAISDEACATHGPASYRLETIKPLSVSRFSTIICCTLFHLLVFRPLSTIICCTTCCGD